MIKLNNNFIFNIERNKIRQMENISIAYPINDVIVDLSIPAAPARVIEQIWVYCLRIQMQFIY
jgi:hypothetical protein